MKLYDIEGIILTDDEMKKITDNIFKQLHILEDEKITLPVVLEIFNHCIEEAQKKRVVLD